MAGRVAIDFGTSNTVVASWDTVRQQGIVLPLPDYARILEMGEEQTSVVPSLIHYGTSAQRWYGNQVIQRNLAQSGRSFQWMKRYICMRSPATRNIDDNQISNFQAGQDFLSKILSSVKTELELGDEEIALTLPVEAFEHYENWLAALAHKAGLSRVRFIDEPSAAALGYSTRMFAEEACLVFDFGGGALDISIVQQLPAGESGSQRCRVLGKAGIEISGSIIDEWLFQDIVQLNGYTDADTEIQQISRLLLSECEGLKERLSFQEKSSLTVVNPLSGSVMSTEYTRGQLEALLESKNGYAMIERALERALADARERGFDQDKFKAVLMVGGSSLIPSVQNMLKRIFGKDKVKLDRPLDAIARGAAAFVAGQSFDDYLQHDYAVRYRNTATQQYEYRNLVKRGSQYPSAGMLATVNVKAIYNGQEEFMMQIFEISENGRGRSNELELCFDEAGNARLNTVTQTELEQRNMFWVNEKNPTLLKADPPASKGEERFEVSFAVDGNRRLLITTRDLKSGKLMHQDFPVVGLS